MSWYQEHIHSKSYPSPSEGFNLKICYDFNYSGMCSLSMSSCAAGSGGIGSILSCHGVVNACCLCCNTPRERGGYARANHTFGTGRLCISYTWLHLRDGEVTHGRFTYLIIPSGRGGYGWSVHVYNYTFGTGRLRLSVFWFTIFTLCGEEVMLV